MSVRRFWLYGKGRWDGRAVLFGCDEHARKTLLIRLPGKRALVWAFWTWRDAEADEIRAETARDDVDAAAGGMHHFADAEQALAWLNGPLHDLDDVARELGVDLSDSDQALRP